MTFLFVYRPNKQGFTIKNLSADESDALNQHYSFLKGHHEQGELYMAGRHTDGDFGFAIVEAETLGAAIKKSEQDPAVKNGVFRVEVHPFDLAII